MNAATATPAAQVRDIIMARRANGGHTSAVVTRTGLLIVAGTFASGQLAVALAMQDAGLAAGALGRYTIELRRPAGRRTARVARPFSA